MPTRPFAFTGFLYLDKIVAEFHRIPAVIHKFFKQLICRAAIVSASQIFQDVAAQKASLVLIHMPTQQIPCTDAFQLKVLDILQQFVNQFAERDDGFAGISTVDLIQQVIDAIIGHCHSPRFLHLKMRGVFSWMDILVREYRCSGGTDTASPAAGNRCSGTEIPHLIDCYLRVHSLKAGSNPYTSRIDR